MKFYSSNCLFLCQSTDTTISYSNRSKKKKTHDKATLNSASKGCSNTCTWVNVTKYYSLLNGDPPGENHCPTCLPGKNSIAFSISCGHLTPFSLFYYSHTMHLIICFRGGVCLPCLALGWILLCTLLTKVLLELISTCMIHCKCQWRAVETCFKKFAHVVEKSLCGLASLLHTFSTFNFSFLLCNCFYQLPRLASFSSLKPLCLILFCPLCMFLE